MDIEAIKAKYIVDARNKFEKQAKLAAMSEATELRKLGAEARGDRAGAAKANRRLTRLNNIALHSVGGDWYTVKVSGTFEDKVKVPASTPKEAEKQAVTLLMRMYPKLKLTVSKTEAR